MVSEREFDTVAMQIIAMTMLIPVDVILTKPVHNFSMNILCD
jgi:hypothetical protein